MPCVLIPFLSALAFPERNETRWPLVTQLDIIWHEGSVRAVMDQELLARWMSRAIQTKQSKTGMGGGGGDGWKVGQNNPCSMFLKLRPWYPSQIVSNTLS